MKIEFIITLLETTGIGKVTVRKILNHKEETISNLTELRELIEFIAKDNKRIIVPSVESLIKSNQQANNILLKSEKEGIHIIDTSSTDFPNSLLEIENPPIVLHYKGNKSLLSDLNNIAVIGTREPSEIGIKLGERITEIFVSEGYNIVSGLAIGCDSIAHETCLNKGGKTIAILANGLDKVYPKQNKKLADDILKNDGLLLSEYVFGQNPIGNFFVERDRLQSGISQAICVIETDIKGGTMHTVGFAEKQGRLISCINHPVEHRNHPKTNGNQMLINTNRAYSLGSKSEIQNFLEALKSRIKKSNNAFNDNEEPNNIGQQAKLDL